MILRTCFLAMMIVGGCSHKAPLTLQDPPPHLTLKAPKAKLYHSILREDQPIQTLSEALKEDPSSVYLLSRLAEELLKKNELDKAEEIARKTIDLCPACKAAHTTLGRVYQQKTDYASAEKAYVKAIALQQEEDDAPAEDILLLANVYLQTKQYEKAIDLLKNYSRKDPENEFIYYYLARIYSETDRLDLAEQTYKQIVQINPEFPHSYKALGIICEFKGNIQQALEYYGTALQLEPENIDLAKHVTMLYLELKKFPEAKENLAKLTLLQPADLDVKIRLGLLYLRDNQYEEAKMTFEKALKTNPASSQIKYYLAVIYERNKKQQQALNLLKGVAPESGFFSESQQAMALIYESQGKSNKAKSTLDAALRTHGHDINLHIAQAKLLAKQKKSGEAISVLQRQRIKFAKNEQLLFTLGEIYDQRGDFKNLTLSFKSLLEINPENVDALNYLGFAYAEKGVELAEAEKLVSRALKLRPEDGYIIDSLGWIYYKMGKYAESLKHLMQASTLVPNEPVILEHLGDVYSKMSHFEEARQTYQQALKNSKEEIQKRRLASKLKILLVRR